MLQVRVGGIAVNSEASDSRQPFANQPAVSPLTYAAVNTCRAHLRCSVNDGPAGTRTVLACDEPLRDVNTREPIEECSINIRKNATPDNLRSAIH